VGDRESRFRIRPAEENCTMNCIRAMCVLLVLWPGIVFAADEPLTHVKELLTAGKFKEARTEAVRERDAFAAANDAYHEAAAWLFLGLADASLDDVPAARAEMTEAITRFIAVEDYYAAWLSHVALGELEKNDGQYGAAAAAYERALETLDKAAAPAARFSLESFRLMAPATGMQIQGLGPLGAHPEILKPIFVRLAVVLTRDGFSGVLLEAGELERAEEQLTKANAEAGMFLGMLNTSIAVRMGDLRRYQWRLDEAREQYLQALNGNDIMRAINGGNLRAETALLGKLAKVELLAGRVEEALGWNDRALKLAREAQDARRAARVLEDRAALLHTAGRYEDALALYDEILQFAVQTKDVSWQASIHADIGAAHMFQGTYGSSVKHLEKAIELYQQIDEPYAESATWILLAEVHMQFDMDDNASHDLDQARKLAKKSGFTLAGAMVDMILGARDVMNGNGSVRAFDTALQTWRELPETRSLGTGDMMDVLRACFNATTGAPGSPAARELTRMPAGMQGMTMFLRGKALFDAGKSDEALGVWKQALETNPNADVRAGLLGIIGATLWNDGKREEGLRYFRQASTTLEKSANDVKVEEMLAGYFGHIRRAYYDLLIDMLVHEGHTWEAFAQAERARSRAFLRMVGNHRFNPERGGDPLLVREAEILRTEIAARERALRQAAPAQQALLATELDRARQRYKLLLPRVKLSNPEYESLTNVEPLDLAEARAQVPSDTTLISYFVSPRVVHAWVVERESIHYERWPVDQATLLRLACWAGRFGAPLGRGVAADGGCSDGATAEHAFEQLFAPLQASVHHRRLIVVPHGVLHYVPFAALRNPATGRYLIEDYTITYAPSASALRFMREKESPVDRGTLILGDPQSALSRLPGAADEATAIGEIFASPPRLGSDAQESVLYDLAGRYDLVHLAAHGEYDAAHPLFSRIALASGDGRDGNLTVDEILSSVDLTGVNLVVLSACRSAVGARSGGDEVVGLTRALLYAGTPGVISTLWDIDDAAAASLMKEFYRRLAAGASIADSLREAQLATLASERFRDPHFWAGFTLSGDPQGRWKRADP
jgi:CHAT domain-containing protein